MDYKFRYKSSLNKISWKKIANSKMSDFIFYLYKNWIFRKLKLDRNQFLKEFIKHQSENRKKIQLNFPDNINLKVESITFIDCIEIEQSSNVKTSLLRLFSSYESGFLFNNPSKKLDDAFENFDYAYKTTTWGNLHYSDTKEINKLDLIKGISYGYIKGPKSHFIITYKVYPTDKFKSLFLESLSSEIVENSEIVFNSLKQILKSNRFISSIKTNVKRPSYHLNKLFDEINYQFKFHVVNNFRYGIFNKDKRLLFPRIVSFSYNQNQFSSCKENICKILGVTEYEFYSSDEFMFTLKPVDYSKSLSNSLEVFYPISSDNDKNHLNIDRYFIEALAPFWMLINISSLNRRTIMQFRKKIYLYINSNKVKLFFNHTLKLKSKLSLKLINFERIKSDFDSTNAFENHLTFSGIHDAYNSPFNDKNKREFKESLINYSSSVSNDIKNSYSELLELFKHVSDDNLIRANMRLQRILLFIAIAGVIIAIYSTNSEWFNQWLKKLFL